MFVIVIVIALLVVALILFKAIKKDKEASAELAESLKDERIYDHVSGRYLTLEEAENEVIDGNKYINRIKSDEEIQKHFSEDEREVEYIIRDMIQSSISETEDERIFELVEFSQLYGPDDYSIHYLWEIKPDHFLGIAYVTHYYPNGTQIRDHENQLFGIVQGNTLTAEFEANAEIQFIELNNTRVFKIPRKISFNEFKRFKDLI